MINELQNDNENEDAIQFIDPEQSPEIIDNGDDTATVMLDAGVVKTDSGDFAANLADSMPDDELNNLALKYLDLIDEDIRGREDRDKQYADGLKKTGIAEPAPGGASFEGASRVTHPVLANAYVDFSASAIKELFPPNGPVRSKIEGNPNHEKIDKARRKTEFMNWQLIYEIKGYRAELERLLTQLPAGGTQFLKLYWSNDRGRIEAEFVPIDDYILPYNARNFYNCQRKFHRINLSSLDLMRRIDIGDYRDWSLPKAMGSMDDPTKAAAQNNKIEGKASSTFSDDVDRVIYEGVIYEQFDCDDRPLPYLITIDEESQKVLALYRNWSENDPKCEELETVVDFNFIPWRGALGIGLPQLIGGLSDALTGSLRALMDSALINNAATVLKLKGSPSGSDNTIDITQATEIDAMGADDIRKIAMPMPFNQPSPVLFQLLGFLTSAAEGVVGTAEEKIADASNSMPVGTALALIEQGAKVFSAIHARLHDSQRRALEIVHRLNAEHLPEKVQYGSDPEDYVTRADFEGRMDVHPVSDPNIFSESQRFAQTQAILQLVSQLAPIAPQVQQMGVNVKKLISRSMEQMKFPDYQEIMPPDPTPLPTNPMLENVNMVMGKPVKAFEQQDHQAHLQVHLDFAKSQFYGMSEVMPPQFGVTMLNHIQDHLLNFYQHMMTLSNPSGTDDGFAASAQTVDKATELAFGQVPQIIQQALQILKSKMPQPPQNPTLQIATQQMQTQAQIEQQKLQMQQQENQSEIQIELQKMQAKLQEMQLKYQTVLDKEKMQVAADMQKAVIDANTAKEIEAMRIAHGQKPHITSGSSLDDNPMGGML